MLHVEDATLGQAVTRQKGEYPVSSAQNRRGSSLPQGVHEPEDPRERGRAELSPGLGGRAGREGGPLSGEGLMFSPRFLHNRTPTCGGVSD